MIKDKEFKEKIYPIILKEENGYSNIKSDRGGETYNGISRIYFPNWEGWKFLDKILIKKRYQKWSELNDLTYNFYLKLFIDNKFHLLNSWEIALLLFDWLVNGGYSFAKLQSVFTIKSMSDVNNISIANLMDRIFYLRRKHYADIIKKTPSQSVNEKGWNSRLDKLQSLVGYVSTSTPLILLFVLFIGLFYVLL